MAQKTANSLETSDRIRREAAKLFVERGYAATTVKEVARQVGMTSGALYWHFPSKEAILFAHLVTSMEELVQEARLAAKGGTPTERIMGLARAHVLVGLRQTDEGTVDANHGIVQLARFLGEEERAQIATLQRRHLRFVKQILREGMSTGDFRTLDLTPTAFAILTLCDFASIWWRPRGRLSPAGVADLYADLVRRMVCVDGSG